MVDFAALRAPFPADRISWRVGSTNKDKTRGMALAYIDARDVQDRLDAVCGHENWQCRYPHAGDKKTVCEIGIRVGNEWVWKSDGAGDTDFEAEKGALSDAFKRAAVRWGIGRYLYDVDAPWVAIEAFGKSFKIQDGEIPKLRACLSQNGAPARIPAPQPLAPSDADAKTRAIKWANNAIELLRSISPREFSEWHGQNSDKIAAIKKYDEQLHIRLLAAIAAKQNAFHPMSA